MDQHLIAYYVGIFTVFASHAFMLYKPQDAMKLMTMEQYSYLNITAVVLIAYYFANKEGFIKF
jgi:hypothetical protein